jgi:citrate lyase subunit alpha/citrate CoA-transferase
VAELPDQRVHHPGDPLVPGELIDVVVTERGIAINPRREDLLRATEDSDLPIRPIDEIRAEVEAIVGGPPEPAPTTDRPVAIIKWVDGTVLDTVWEVAP